MKRSAALCLVMSVGLAACQNRAGADHSNEAPAASAAGTEEKEHGAGGRGGDGKDKGGAPLAEPTPTSTATAAADGRQVAASSPAQMAAQPISPNALGGGANARSALPAARPSPKPTQTTPADPAQLGVMNTDAKNGAVAATSAALALAAPPPPAPGDAPEAPPVPTLDRNARYATTYRPGGAALAAFDAAVTKGSIPTTYKDLVGDFGGRYAPTLSVPDGQAMAFQVEADRAKLAPSGGLVNLRISMRSSETMPTRAPLSVHLVLDVSGSMQGLAIENAKQAAETLVQKLEPQDDFSMVIFSDDAQVLVDDGPAVARRDRILSAIRRIQAEGGTNISSGLDAGYKLAHTGSINPDAVKIVMFLSDGHANAGDVDPVHLAERSAKAFQDGIQTSSFGLGADYDAQIMSSVADQGAGGYYYLADSSQIAPALGRELDARLVPVARAVEVRLRLRPEVAPRKVFGSHALDRAEAARVRQQEIVVDTQVAKRDNIKKDRQTDADGGMRFFMPAFARDDRHAMLITVEVPDGVGDTTIGSVEIKYKDRLAKKNVTQEIAIRTSYAASDAESAASTNASVAATVQAFAAGDAILKAADAIDRGNRAYAAQVLRERAELLKRASGMLEEPRLGEEAQRLARLSLAVNGDQKVQDALPLALMLRGSGYGYLR